MDHGTNILKLLSTYMLASTKMYRIYFYYLLSQAVDVQCFSEQDCKAPPPTLFEPLSYVPRFTTSF